MHSVIPRAARRSIVSMFAVGMLWTATRMPSKALRTGGHAGQRAEQFQGGHGASEGTAKKEHSVINALGQRELPTQQGDDEYARRSGQRVDDGQRFGQLSIGDPTASRTEIQTQQCKRAAHAAEG